MFYFVQAGSSLQIVDTAGAINQTLTLPTGVTIDTATRGRAAILSQQILFARASSVNLWIDPSTTPYTVRPMSTRPPMGAPTLAAGTLGGLTGAYRMKVSFLVKDDSGRLLAESPLGPQSPAFTLTAQSLNATNIPVSTESHVTGRRLYRTVAGGSVFFQMLDIDDNVTASLDSAVLDAALELLPEDPELGNPPGAMPGTSLDLLIVWRNRLWAKSRAQNEVDRILFSDLDKFYAWSATNFLLATPVGEDTFGITGFIPRRDELVVCKRSRIMKVVGNSEEDFEVIIIAEGVGCQAADSCVVIRDVGYFLGLDGVYTVGPDGVKPISRDKVDPWFLTDTYFNRALFDDAVGGYNPITDSYDLLLAAAGSSNLDRWVSYDIRRKEWIGPHLTTAFTPTMRGFLRDADSNGLPTFGASDGKLYKMNQSGASDNGTAISTDWISKWFAGQAPDLHHVWLEPSFFVKTQAGTPGPLVVTPKVGDLAASNGTAQNIPQTIDRSRLARFGAGRLLRLQFTHATNAEDVELRGYELPFVEAGRR